MKNQLSAVPILRVALAANILLIALTCGTSSLAASSDATSNLSLARAFPVEKVAELLIPRDRWHPFPALKGAGNEKNFQPTD
jgi:hypothetical protein